MCQREREREKKKLCQTLARNIKVLKNNDPFNLLGRIEDYMEEMEQEERGRNRERERGSDIRIIL